MRLDCVKVIVDERENKSVISRRWRNIIKDEQQAYLTKEGWLENRKEEGSEWSQSRTMKIYN